MLDWPRGSKSRQNVRSAGEDLRQFNIQPGLGGRGGQEIGHTPFTRLGMFLRKEGGVDAGQRDEFAHEFFNLSHGSRVRFSPRGARQTNLDKEVWSPAFRRQGGPSRLKPGLHTSNDNERKKVFQKWPLRC